MRIDGWKSGYASVDSVVRHLQRKSGGYGTPSSASLEGYAPKLTTTPCMPEGCHGLSYRALRYFDKAQAGANPCDLLASPSD